MNTTLNQLNEWRHLHPAYWHVKFIPQSDIEIDIIGWISFDDEESELPPTTRLHFGDKIPDVDLTNIVRHRIRNGYAFIHTDIGLFYITPLFGTKDHLADDCKFYTIDRN